MMWWQQDESVASVKPEQSYLHWQTVTLAMGTEWGIEPHSHVSAAYPFCGGTGREVVSLTTGYEQGSKDVLKQNLHTDLEDAIRLFFLRINTH